MLQARDVEDAARLWEISERLTETSFSQGSKA